MPELERTARGTVFVAFHSELLGGATISVLRVIPLLERRGWRFAYWVPRPGPAFDSLRERGANVRGAPRPIASGLAGLRESPGLAKRLALTPGYLREFRTALRATAPALVHANSLYSFAEALTARACGFRALLHLHDMAPASRKAAPARAIVRRGPNVTVAVSRACAASYAGRGWSPDVVYEAAPLPDEPASIRTEPRPFVVGTVGVISRRKGSDVFVEAARRVRAVDGEIQFELVGAATDVLDRTWAHGVLQAAREAGVAHTDTTDISSALQRWDAFVLPSRRDPCPIALLEAMAAGLPVIGSRADGIPEQIAPGCGVLVDRDDPAGLAAAIVDLARLPASERAAMGAAARRRVQREFSLERQAAGLHQAYLAALEP